MLQWSSVLYCLCNSTRNTLSENFNSNGQELQSLGGKKCWKMVKYWLQFAQNGWSYEFDFCCVCGWASIEATNWSRHFDWVWWGMSRHVQSSFKWWVSNISRMSWGMKVFEFSWIYNKFIQAFQLQGHKGNIEQLLNSRVLSVL